MTLAWPAIQPAVAPRKTAGKRPRSEEPDVRASDDKVHRELELAEQRVRLFIEADEASARGAPLAAPDVDLDAGEAGGELVDALLVVVAQSDEVGHVNLDVWRVEKQKDHIRIFRSDVVFSSGEDGARTHDLLTASQVLSQLSYFPVCGRHVVGRRRDERV